MVSLDIFPTYPLCFALPPLVDERPAIYSQITIFLNPQLDLVVVFSGCSSDVPLIMRKAETAP
jgi:hypothetical protein